MVDEELILREMEFGEDKSFGSTYGGICVTEDKVKIIKYFSQKLGLDPAQGDIKLIITKSGINIYITANGLRNATSYLTKSNVTEMVEMDREEYPPRYVTYRCTIVTTDGRTFSQEGSYDLTEWKQKDKPTLHRIKSMAETRATARTQRLILGSVAKSLNIWDDLPESEKKKEVIVDKDTIKAKEVKPERDAVDVEFEEDTDFLNEDLEVKEDVIDFEKEAEEIGFDPTADLISSIEKEPEILTKKKDTNVKDELFAMFDDMLDTPVVVDGEWKGLHCCRNCELCYENQVAMNGDKGWVCGGDPVECIKNIYEINDCSHIRPIFSLLTSPTLEEEIKKVELPPAAGHGFVIECIRMANPTNKDRCIEILTNPASEECVYFFDWFRTIINNNFHDIKCIKGADPKKNSPPIVLYELLTKKSIEIQGTGKYWIECISENDKDALQGLLFSVLVDLYDRHKKAEVKEYPHRPLVKRYVNGSSPLTTWIMKLYKDQEGVDLP